MSLTFNKNGKYSNKKKGYNFTKVNRYIYTYKQLKFHN